MRHLLSVLVYNEPGVLSRVVGLFSGRGFNITSLNVAPILDLDANKTAPATKGKAQLIKEADVSLITITTSGDAQIMEQIIKQLHKLIPVIKVMNFEGIDTVQREMMLLKVNAFGDRREEILRIADIFRCKVVDVGLTDITLEVTGDYEKVEAIIGLYKKFGIKDLARAGTMAMRRSMQREGDRTR